MNLTTSLSFTSYLWVPVYVNTNKTWVYFLLLNLFLLVYFAGPQVLNLSR